MLSFSIVYISNKRKPQNASLIPPTTCVCLLIVSFFVSLKGFFERYLSAQRAQSSQIHQLWLCVPFAKMETFTGILLVWRIVAVVPYRK